MKIANIANIKAIKAEKTGVYSLAFTPDSRILISGGGCGEVQVWDVATQEAIATLSGHTDTVSSLAVSPDGQILASGSNDRTISIYSLTKQSKIALLKNNDKELNALAFSPDGKILASGSADGIRLWNMKVWGEYIMIPSLGTCCLAFSPDGKTLYTGDWYGKIKIWDVVTQRKIAVVDAHKSIVTAIAVTMSYIDDLDLDWCLVTASDDRTIKTWSPELHNKLVLEEEEKENGEYDDIPWGEDEDEDESEINEFTSITIAPDGNIISGSRDRRIKIWDIATGRVLDSSEELSGVTSVAFSPDGKIFAAANHGRVFKENENLSTLSLWRWRD